MHHDPSPAEGPAVPPAPLRTVPSRGACNPENPEAAELPAPGASERAREGGDGGTGAKAASARGNRQTPAFVAPTRRPFPYPADGGTAPARGGHGTEDRGRLAFLVAGEVRGPLAVGAGGERRPVARREVLQVELHVNVLSLLSGRERHIVGDQLALQLVFGEHRGVF